MTTAELPLMESFMYAVQVAQLSRKCASLPSTAIKEACPVALPGTVHAVLLADHRMHAAIPAPQHARILHSTIEVNPRHEIAWKCIHMG